MVRPFHLLILANLRSDPALWPAHFLTASGGDNRCFTSLKSSWPKASHGHLKALGSDHKAPTACIQCLLHHLKSHFVTQRLLHEQETKCLWHFLYQSLTATTEAICETGFPKSIRYKQLSQSVSWCPMTTWCYSEATVWGISALLTELAQHDEVLQSTHQLLLNTQSSTTREVGQRALWQKSNTNVIYLLHFQNICGAVEHYKLMGV